MYLLRGQDVYTWVQVPMDTRASDPVKWQAVVSHPVWALGTKPRSSASRAHALNHQGFSLQRPCFKNNEMLSGVLPLPPYPECTWASIDAAGMVGEGPSGQTQNSHTEGPSPVTIFLTLGNPFPLPWNGKRCVDQNSLRSFLYWIACKETPFWCY